LYIKLSDILTDAGKKKIIVDFLYAGKIMLYPTETVYGIGCNSFSEEGIKRIIEIKQRDLKKPLIVLVKDVHMLKELAADIPPFANKLIKEFWPGPLTIIFKARPYISNLITAGTGKIGLRQSPHPLLEYIFTVYNHPIISTSANVSNEKEPSSLLNIPAIITDKVDLIIDGGKINNTPSTIIDATGRDIEYIREGAIKRSVIEKVLYDRDKTI